MTMMWRLLQLSDSGFPMGGFAHSGGLEAACAMGEMKDVRRSVEDAVWAAAHGALPLVRRAWRGDVEGADAEAEAFLVVPVANRASRAQGRALAATCTTAF